MKAIKKFKKQIFKEDTIKNRDMKDLSISYVYEEDDPKKVPNRRLGELLMDK